MQSNNFSVQFIITPFSAERRYAHSHTPFLPRTFWVGEWDDLLLNAALKIILKYCVRCNGLSQVRHRQQSKTDMMAVG